MYETPNQITAPSPDVAPPSESHDTTNSDFVHSLAESSLRDETIKRDLRSSGFKQFEPPYTGFIPDTFPYYLNEEQGARFREDQNQKKLEFFSTMDPVEKASIAVQRKKYDATINYLSGHVQDSLELLKNSKYGLREVFKNVMDGQVMNSSTIIELMKLHNIKVAEFPNQQIGFDGKTNHAEARYTKNEWQVKLNAVALGNPREIVHELAAIESFDPYLRNKPSLGEAVKALPAQIFTLLLSGKPIRESLARGQYIGKGLLSIPLLETYYDILTALGGKSPFVQGFSRYLTNEP